MNSASSPLADFAREWFQKVWNERDESAIDRMLGIQATLEGLPLADATIMRGPDEFKFFYRAILAGIPDIKVTVTQIVEQGDWVAVRFVCEGTHSGDGLGVLATNRKVCFSSLAMGRVEGNQWIEGWNLMDVPTLQQQIGGALRLG